MSLKEKLIKLHENETETEAETDWEKRKNEWLKSVEKFYSLVREWLSEYEKEELLRIDTQSIAIYEENIGKYSADKLIIRINGKRQVILEPVGALIIGCQGRIDVYLRGNVSDKDMIVLTREKGIDSWYFVDKKSRLKQPLVTKQSFEEKFEEWLNL